MNRAAAYWRFAAAGLLLCIVLACAFPGLLSAYSPIEINFKEKLQPPDGDHWMGTDEMGRDVFTRLLYGGRVTIFSALVISCASLLIAVLWAGFSSFAGGWWDEVMTRAVDLLMNVPALLFALVFVSMFEPGMFSLVLSLVLIKWASFARILRGHMMGVMNTEFITAARSVGCSRFWIIRRYLVTNTIGLVITLFGLNFAGSMMSIAGLNFLGFGVSLPTPEWGAMINAARPFLQTQPYLTIYPGAAIALTVLLTYSVANSFNHDNEIL